MARSPETADITEPTTAELSAQIDALKTDLAAIAETLTTIGRARGQAVADAARDEAYNLKARGEEKVAELQNHAAELTSQANQMLRENPAAVLGVAAGAGFLVGVLLSRR